MPKQRHLTAEDFRPRRSKFMRDEHAKDEQQLAVIAIMAGIVAAVAVYLMVSGTANRFIENAATIYQFLF